jgi:hypothetical protein
MPVGVNVPVMIGPVPLLYVQSIQMSEGYKIERIAGSRFSQAIAPTTKTIAVEAMLTGRERQLMRKALEAMALTSRILVAAAAPLMAVTGIPVISGFTIALDMQITDLRFSQTIGKRDALDVSVSLRHVPRGVISAIAGEALDLALAAGTAAIPTTPAPNPIPRAPGP